MEIVVLEVMDRVVFVLIFNGITVVTNLYIGYDTTPIFQVYQQFSSLNSPTLNSLLLNATNSTSNTFACHIKFLYLTIIFLLATTYICSPFHNGFYYYFQFSQNFQEFNTCVVVFKFLIQ